MNLHRTTGRPDWVDVPPARRNLWQTWADRTGGIVTPGNVITVAGLIIAAAGLWYLITGRVLLAAGLIVAGRAFDLLDGFLAAATGTKSPLGEIMDASSDKIITFLGVIALGLGGYAPVWSLAVLIVPNAIIAAEVLYGRARGTSVHPSRLGKLSMAVAWAALVAFVAQHGRTGTLGAVLQWTTYILLAATTLMTLAAAAGYARELKSARLSSQSGTPKN